jgi:diguanylate cyclase (GGDEF)-like protein/PAS domain S-box-containing protein
MKIFKPHKYNSLVIAGIMLLVAAGIGLYLSLPLLVNFSSAGTLPEGMGPVSLGRISALALTVMIAAVVVVLAAMTRVRWETLQRKRCDIMLGLLRRGADASTDLITILSLSGRIEYVNDAVERATGYAKKDLINRRLSPCLPWYDDAALVRRMRETVLQGNEFVQAIDGITRSGELLALQEHVIPFRNAAGAVTRMISTAQDLTRERDLEDRIDYLDRYDRLTGLPNRNSLVDLLEHLVAAVRSRGGFVSVLVLDIDQFKNVNDLHCVETGDEVLKQISRRIRDSVSPTDVVARMGNDEFVVVHIDDQKPMQAGSVAEKLSSSISQKITAGVEDIMVTVSIGIAAHPGDGDDAWSLLKNADLALARAKAQGRNSIQFYDPEIKIQIKEFFVLEKRLFAALKNNEYVLHYQPYCDLQTRKISGAEALVRWKNPDLGVVSPARFIPSLEDTGMVIDVGRWILETACGQIKAWERKNRNFPVSVNLSPIQFRHQHLVGMVQDTINDFRLDPARLTLEVTETVLMHDMDFAIRILKRLKDVGVMLSVDDFGTGYSSLSYIKKMPVDNLKIDISFVRDITKDPDSVSIVTAITALARSLELKTIAEGVETEEQRNILHLLRCDMGQGYLFSPALAAPAFDRIHG